MNGWQIAITAVLGVLSTSGAFAGARMGARANDRATAQRELAARREEVWRRFTWAADLALDESTDKRVIGLKTMIELAKSDLLEEDDLRLLDAFHQRVLDRILHSTDEDQSDS